MLCAHLQAVAVDGPSVFGHGENRKKLQNREFRSDPVYTNPVGNFPNRDTCKLISLETFLCNCNCNLARKIDRKTMLYVFVLFLWTMVRPILLQF